MTIFKDSLPFTNGEGCCWSKGPPLTAAATAATAVAEGFRRVLETLLPPWPTVLCVPELVLAHDLAEIKAVGSLPRRTWPPALNGVFSQILSKKNKSYLLFPNIFWKSKIVQNMTFRSFLLRQKSKSKSNLDT